MNRRRALVKKFIPSAILDARVRANRSLSALVEIVPAYLYDMRRFLRHSSSNGPYGSRDNMRAKITATYHNIEKGLSLPSPRPGFGVQPVNNLIKFMTDYSAEFGRDEWLQVPTAVLCAYRDFNLENDVLTGNDLDIEAYLDSTDCDSAGLCASGGTKRLTRDEVLSATKDVNLDFFTSRSSIRQFSDAPVDIADIRFAALAAQKSPAVCNRQFGRTYVYLERGKIDEIIALQGGTNGFGAELSGVAIITTDLRSFWAAGERNQAWTDGGMFAMSFVLGLHARGLGAVCLNWSKGPALDRKIRRVANLPEESVVVMLVGFGALRNDFQVAVSPRIDLNDTLHIR